MRKMIALCFSGVLMTGACAASRSGPSTITSVPPPAGPVVVSNDEPGTMPAGQLLDVRLQDALSSGTATVEQRFDASTVVGLMQNGRTLVPAGSRVQGIVRGVDPASRTDRAGSLTLAFTSLRVNGREIPIRGMATQVFESGGLRDEGGTAGVGAGVGGVIGGIVGGVRGALLGAIIGAGGAIVATAGRDIQLPAGAIVRVRLDAPVEVR